MAAVLRHRAANEFAKGAILLNRKINEEESIQSREVIKAQRDEARVRLDAAEHTLLEFKRQAQLELARKDSDALLDKRGKMLELRVDIEALRSRLAEADRQLLKQDRVLPAPRDPARETDLATADRSLDPFRQTQGPAQGQRLGPELPLASRTMNPVWELLAYQSALTKTRLQQLEREHQTLVTDHGVNAPHLAALDKVYRSEIQQARFELEKDIASRVYAELATQYEQARVRIASRSTELQLVDPARVPTQQSSRRALLASVGGLGGLTLGMLLAEFLPVARRKSTAPGVGAWSER